MQVVVAFDIDGTLETSSGPVKIDRLNELVQMGVNIWIVSPSGLSPNRRTTNPTAFHEAINGDRVANLKQVHDLVLKEITVWYGEDSNLWPGILWIYVSDNKDYDAAKQAGFCFIEASQFV